jgi:hypothetical protein
VTSTGGGSIGFNVFSNTSTASRTGVIQVEGASNKVTLTIDEAGSTAPILNREVAYLYQHILGREPDASGLASGPDQTAPAIGRVTADLVTAHLMDSPEARTSAFQVMGMYQAVSGSAPEYSAWLAAVQALRNGTPAPAQFAAILSGSSCSQSPQALAECLYKNMLGRDPAPAEFNAGSATEPFLLFTRLFESPEFRSSETFTSDHTNSLYVTMLYYLILERAPDESELAHWLNIANSGGPGIYYNQRPGSTQLLIVGNGRTAGLTGTTEFLSKFQ